MFPKEATFEMTKKENKIQPSTEETQDDLFTKLNIADFIAGRELQKMVSQPAQQALQFDLYIRLSASKFVKIAHQGHDLPIDQITSYLKKGIQFVWMKKEDFKKYLGFNIGLSQAVEKNSKVSKEKQMVLLKHTSEVVLTYLHSNEINEETFEAAKTVVESAAETLSDYEEAYDLITDLNNHTDYLYAQSVAVSFYGALNARQLKWNSSVTIMKITMAGLLHDIGKKEIDRAVLEKPRYQLTSTEIKLIETHPARGMEILAKIPAIPSEILQIVIQHHENCLGQGYPVGLKKSQIHPLARLIAVADTFATLVIKSPDSPGMKPKEAFHQMLKLNLDTLDPGFLVPLMGIFKYEIPQNIANKMKVLKAA